MKEKERIVSNKEKRKDQIEGGEDRSNEREKDVKIYICIYVINIYM